MITIPKLKLQKITYDELHGRQQENYNYHKLSAILADFGYNAIRLDDDWQGADFIAQHLDGKSYIKIQLKSRLTFEKKYMNKDLWIAFPHGKDWYLFPYDYTLNLFLPKIGNSQDWAKGKYSYPTLSLETQELLKEFKISN